MLDAVDYTDNSGGLRRLDFPHAGGFGLPPILVSTKDTSKAMEQASEETNGTRFLGNVVFGEISSSTLPGPPSPFMVSTRHPSHTVLTCSSDMCLAPATRPF